MEAVGTLAGGIAHDFNNILAAIIGHAELLGQDLPPDPGLHEEVAAILRASRRARDLVQQILTFSRRRERDQRPMALQSVILEALKLLRATLPATVDIRTQVDTAGPIVSADATAIHQIIVNLCTNAAHAMAPQGGVLTVGYTGADVDDTLARAHRGMRPGRYARLTVSDTGHGMDRQTLERIFEPFFTTKAPGEGTGLGLSVVHGIVHSHGGMVTVRSLPGRGTTFDLYFPAVSGSAASEVAEEPRPPLGGGEHLLVVDDEPALVNIARRMLEQLGYRVTAHSRPLQALDAFEAEPATFDLVLCDLTMPQMTGLDFAARVRRIRPDLPVVLTSGYSGSLDSAELQQSGIRELVGKPFASRTLAEAVARHLLRR
jgi:CheY-like chemotaxis protein